ncbi:SpoIIE family protein phosphatase [Geobacter sp.]|uniref:SpoIIE family protein phosphatase n=1 Tax=Geobacter sp. TaxID=46610 RepID=UPI0026016857|nr:SpoIIE family protein phosphatase [Geobacter sp.]
MKKPSDPTESWDAEREKIIGLGERSLRKTYYPELQQKLDELERFRSLLDQSNDCIFLLGIPSLAFVDVNESACRQLGCTRQELLDGALGKIVPAEALERIRELVAVGPGEGRDRDTIVTDLYRCSGEGFPVEITIRLVRFQGDLYGVAVARDITERKRAEEALLENSRLLREMELARQIQLSLLPGAPPELAGVQISGCCLPATHVGGDYFDYYRREDGVVDMVVADVSGHSFGAALMMAEARSVLRAQVHAFTGTGDILTSLNDVLHEDLSQAELFITMFYVKYDAATRILNYSNAGHVTPLISRRSARESCCELDADGLILGISKGLSFEEKQLRLEEGDVLILYTDGITEAESGTGEQFGLARLCSIMGAHNSESPGKIIDAVLREVSAFTGGAPQKDDMTMIVMKVV